MKRKLMGLGKYSDVISLPKELLRKLGWRRGQMLEVSAHGRGLRVKDARNK
jgi:bifunctional DNA-binding transcriptional regulator/antitoxin component of YhaV-PrlF toxin-antitoxin module